MSTGRLGLFWQVSYANKYKGTPVKQRTKNDLDAHGLFLDLPRLTKEGDISYWKRLQSVIPLRAGANQEGLVHGITRELGLEEKIGIKITPVFSETKWLAPAPHVEITSTAIILYSSYYGADDEDNVVDTEVDIFDHGDGYLLSDVVSSINSSEYFLVELGTYSTGVERSCGLIPTSSAGIVTGEFIPASTYFLLQNNDIVPYTVTFSEKTIFDSENSADITDLKSNGITLCWSINSKVGKEGEYNIDYRTGTITAYSSPSGNGTIRYQYRSFPLYVRWSPISVYSLRDTNYREKLFEIETALNSEERQGLVTEEGREVYQQIFNKSRCMWGE